MRKLIIMAVLLMCFAPAYMVSIEATEPTYGDDIVTGDVTVGDLTTTGDTVLGGVLNATAGDVYLGPAVTLYGEAGQQVMLKGGAPSLQLYSSNGQHIPIVFASSTVDASMIFRRQSLSVHQITSSTGAETYFNEQGYDKNFRIEGDTVTHLFFLDAGLDRVGINNSVPGATLHVGGDAIFEAAIGMTNSPITDVDYIDFDLVDGVLHQEGRMSWNPDDGTLNVGLKGGV
ncbi:MAG: hypothetical protein KAR06_11780, partial [Deltaproteobacteria bacterium]|nr:hypothetical protein [Deltaproteobacteria bacterium]